MDLEARMGWGHTQILVSLEPRADSAAAAFTGGEAAGEPPDGPCWI